MVGQFALESKQANTAHDELLVRDEEANVFTLSHSRRTASFTFTLTLALYLFRRVPSNEVRKNIRTDNESFKCLPPLFEYALRGRHKDNLLTSTGRTVQSQFGSDTKGPGLLRR